MSWVRNERPRFAWLTNSGELILFDELHSEVLHALQSDGFELDAYPLACALRAIHQVTEDLLSCGDGRPDPVPGLPTPQEMCALVDRELRRQRTLLTPDVIRAVLAAYLGQLRRLDIARVHTF